MQNMKNVITAIDKSGSYRVYLAITTEMVKKPERYMTPRLLRQQDSEEC